MLGFRCCNNLDGQCGRFYIKRRYRRQVHFGFKLAVLTTLLLYLVIPFVYNLSPTVQRHLVFLPYVRFPKDVNFSDAESEGMSGTRNLYLQTEKEIKIGVWHILPKKLISKSKGENDSFWETSLRESGSPIIIYFHGNTGSRAGSHRKELYQMLQDLNLHIIACDYRGYSDSTQISPTETGVVTDAKFVYNWVRQILGNSTANVFIWGHSLGTGVSNHVVANLCDEGNPPSGLILESPFTTLGEEVKHHMLSAMYRYMPAFDYIFVKPLLRNDIAFESSRHIAKIHIPIAILHAKDDPVIPHFLGEKLYHIAKTVRNSSAKPVYFKSFPHGYGHKFICRAPELPLLVKNFLDCCSNNLPCQGFDQMDD